MTFITILKKGFLSSSKLYKKIKEEFPDEKITMEKVSEFINNQKANQIHKSYKKKNFISIVAFFPGDIYQMDLLDFSLYSRQNHGYNFCLCVVDVYSRYAWIIPCKNKTGEEVASAIKKVFETKVPNNITSDNGKEFKNSSVEKLLEENNVKSHYAEPGDHNRMGIVERFNRTVRDIIKKYWEANDTHNWVDEIEKIANNYNTTEHTVIIEKPIDVFLGKKDSQQEIVLPELNYKVGDTVRTKIQKSIVDKGYTPKME